MNTESLRVNSEAAQRFINHALSGNMEIENTGDTENNSTEQSQTIESEPQPMEHISTSTDTTSKTHRKESSSSEKKKRKKSSK